MARYVKHCVCGHDNPDTSNTCEACGLTLAGVHVIDLEALPPVPPSPPPPPAPATLRLVLAADPSRVFEVAAGQTVGVPGRSERPDIALVGVPEEEERLISGCHLQVLLHGAEWYVRHVGHTNYIEVDGKRYTDTSDEVRVDDGSSVFLTHTEVIVRTGDSP